MFPMWRKLVAFDEKYDNQPVILTEFGGVSLKMFENSEKDIEKCPVCGSENIDVIQRITGYLVGSVNSWNSAKKAELKDRVTHGF